SRLVNRRLQLFVSVADRAAFSDFLGRVFQGQTQACEVTLEQQAAAPLPMRDNPCNPCLVVRFEAISVPSGQECRVVMTNITERRRAAELLRTEAERRLILFEQLPDGIVVIDPQTARFVEFNTAAHQQLGYSQAEFAQLTIREVEVNEADAETLARLKGANQTGSVDFETLHRTRQGEIRNIHVTARLVIVRGRAVHQCVWRDTTERKQIEAQSRQLQKAESLSRMAGAIAHNFNNQLAAVMLNLELLQQELPPLAGPDLSLAAALQSARKAANISTQMLVYLGQAAAQREPLDLSEACRQSLPLLQSANPNSAVLKTDLPAPGPVIKANANQIQQVLTNLLSNAWEADSNGSNAVRLSVKLAAAAEIPAAHRFPMGWQPCDPAYACLEVADSGCGITAGDMENIFDPFFTSKFTGRGLGLAVVLGIVREHGGGITVESEPGRGSVFRVFLPVAAAAVPPKAVPVVPAPQSAVHGTVLVVDDEPLLLTTVKLALQRAGFKVFTAADGVAGVALFEQHRDEIQCVVCDLSMPRLDGWGTLTALRQLAPGLPIILSSGYDSARVMAGVHPELPQALLQKPYELKALIQLINQVWPQAGEEKGGAS
ncbi:MAG: ATP-binding protein, partial [Verrucomicrobia bacterium]|nr:ATP-binding protein [Verrucomicrobiota bacterium]